MTQFLFLVVILSTLAVAQLRLPLNRPQASIRNSRAPEFQFAFSGSKLPDFAAGNFTKVEQQSSLCKTKGEKQWTGTVDISDERRLFWWFFDSRSDPENDPIIIWLNGGPGSSSMFGLFNEVGSCIFKPGENETSTNEHSWNNRASVLFIDQPAGVGFADIKPGTPYVSGDFEMAKDMQTFLRLFFSKVFPSRAHLPIHFAGESYGGHYVPTAVKHILDSREFNSADAFRGNISSLILVNALIDWAPMLMGAYESVCTDYFGKILWDEARCSALAKALPEAERLAKACDLSSDGRQCFPMSNYFEPYYYGLIEDDARSGLRNPYNVHKPCLDRKLCADGETDYYEGYLNRPDNLEALGFPRDYVFGHGNEEMLATYIWDAQVYRPTTYEMASILDSRSRYTHLRDTTAPPMRVLVLNGNLDSLSNTPGQKIAYERLAWSGAVTYRVNKWASLTSLLGDAAKTTGDWKRSDDGRLLFVAVDGAGHFVPNEQPETSRAVIEGWINGSL